ncbi:hypothetical protein HDU98_008987 [Podochytrium sp. JEL0797]|nr:hypothetical protein HDU98_008987 [Podochytrium sp. JEL0797]
MASKLPAAADAAIAPTDPSISDTRTADIEELGSAPCLKPCVPMSETSYPVKPNSGVPAASAKRNLESHKGTNFKPLRWKPKSEQTIFSICNCKYTSTPPYCDGSHIDLPLKYLKRVKECVKSVGDGTGRHEGVKEGTVCEDCGFINGMFDSDEDE